MGDLTTSLRGSAPVRWLVSLVLGAGVVIVCIGLVVVSAVMLVVTAPAGLLRRLTHRSS